MKNGNLIQTTMSAGFFLLHHSHSIAFALLHILLAFFLNVFDALRMACNASGNVLYVTLSSGPKSTPIPSPHPHTLTHTLTHIHFLLFVFILCSSLSTRAFQSFVRLIPFLRILLFSSHFIFLFLALRPSVFSSSVYWCKRYFYFYFCWYF